jgi:hypothetical protein
MGTVLFVLTDVSNKIIFQTNRALLDTVQQNMISSGIAWAKYNIENGNIKKMPKEIQLDTPCIGTRDAQLTVTIEKIAHRQAQVLINTSCSFGSQILKHKDRYQIALGR